MLPAPLPSIFASGIAGKVTHRPCRVPAPREVYFVGTSNRGATPAVILLPTCIFPALGRLAGGPRRGKPSRRDAGVACGWAPLTRPAPLRQGDRIRDDVGTRAPLAGEREES
jgi:hypothetical protein